MRNLTTISLLLVAVIHILPTIGVLGAGRLSALYGVSMPDPNLALLMRHRAVLFGLLGGFLAWAALRPPLHGGALLAAWISVASFCLLAALVGDLNAALRRVLLADALAAVALLVGTWSHMVAGE